MSGAAWAAIALATTSAVASGALVALFGRWLSRADKRADQRDEESRTNRAEVTRDLRSVREALATVAEAQRLTTHDLPPITDRLGIVESGHTTLATQVALLRHEITLWREWTSGRVGPPAA